MLRWCQSTFRSLEGCGSRGTLSSIRFYSNCSTRRLTITGRTYENKCVGSGNTTTTRPCELVTQVANTSSAFVPRGPSWQNLVEGRLDTDGEDSKNGDLPSVSSPLLNNFPRDATLEPLQVFNNILSPSFNAAISSQKPTSDTLKQLYRAIKAQSQLHYVTSKQLTQLISLMGSLSLSVPRAPCIYLSTLISRIEEPTPQTYWPFVLEVVRDKETLGRTLSGTDRYWIMRAQLAKVVVADGEILQPGDFRFHALNAASNQYLRIWRHSPDPEIHLPYFQVLLSLSSPEHISTLIRRLCNVLEVNSNPHSRFIDLFCEIILKYGSDFDTKAKERVLSMISTRLSNFSSQSVPSQKRGPPSANKVFDNISKRYKEVALEISDLGSALGMAVFPFYSTKEAPANISRWASNEAAETFSTTTPLEMRWDNLMLLAMYKMPGIPIKDFMPTSVEYPASPVTWRTVFVLITLKGALENVVESFSPKTQLGIQSIVRPLWRAWKSHIKTEDRAMTRIIVATFLRIAATANDIPLAQGCYRFCTDQELFVNSNSSTHAEQLQSQDLIVAHILATVSCKDIDWPEVFSRLARFLPSKKQRDEIVEVLLSYYIPRDIENALGLYMFCRGNDVSISDEVIHALSISFATPRTWEIAIPFLYHPRFTRAQVEVLLGAILRVFQSERLQRIDTPLADKLSKIMWKIYAQESPSKQLKYPIRFFFSIMITSGYPSRAMNIIKAVHRNAPSFFTTRLLLRLVRTFIRYRRLHLATSVLQLAPKSFNHSLDDLRRKLTYSLDRAGASNLAKSVYRTGIHYKGRRTTRESLARLISFRSRLPMRRSVLQTIPALARNPADLPSIKYAISALVRSGRLSAARKLFEQKHHLLDQRTKTSIGNTILHGPLLRLDMRNGRLIRHILRTKDLFEKEYGFLADRVTVNIILQGILRWRQVIDPPKIKALFDHMVRSGYPASSRWRQQHDVPFGTPISSEPHGFNVPSLSSAISFQRHTRPMYKIFIKAFYMQHDVHAAKMVIGILKEEESAAIHVKEERDRARHHGLTRKREQEKSG